MKKLLKFKFLFLVTSVFLSMELDAVKGVYRTEKTRAHQAKLAGVQFLRLAYLATSTVHLYAAFASAIDVLNGRDVSVSDLLKKIAMTSMIDLGGAYSSFYAYTGLTRYIKRLKGSKSEADELTAIPAQFSQANEDDADSAIVEILFHSWIVFSCFRLACKDSFPYKYAFILAHPTLREKYYPKHSVTDPDRVLNFKDKLAMLIAPGLVASRVYTACSSIKAIGSKLKNLVIGSKKELLKGSLGSSHS